MKYYTALSWSAIIRYGRAEYTTNEKLLNSPIMCTCMPIHTYMCMHTVYMHTTAPQQLLNSSSRERSYLMREIVSEYTTAPQQLLKREIISDERDRRDTRRDAVPVASPARLSTRPRARVELCPRGGTPLGLASECAVLLRSPSL